MENLIELGLPKLLQIERGCLDAATWLTSRVLVVLIIHTVEINIKAYLESASSPSILLIFFI